MPELTQMSFETLGKIILSTLLALILIFVIYKMLSQGIG